MIAKYTGINFLGINLYETDIPDLQQGKIIECLSFGEKQILIQLKIKNNSNKKEINISYSKNKNCLEKLFIEIENSRFEKFLEISKSNLESDLIGTRGRMEGRLPFDRLCIIYYNEPGINASKNLDPLIINPSLKEKYLFP
ncbi:MAG: hypothetical protein WC812_00375 [Candidatus Pacearchaeota archaeon]|jgi:hypothetical protein